MARTNHRVSPVLKRKSDTRRSKQNILIVCEGEQTEPNYLAGWLAAHGVNEKASVRVVGMGESTGRLLEEAEILNRERQRRVGYGYDQVWLMMDRDENADFDRCIADAEQKGYRVAWTNNAFELWLCLHFSFMHSQLTREGYIANLEAALRKYVPGFRYRKADKEVYEMVRKYGDEAAAVERAKMLMAKRVGQTPSLCEPGTTVHKMLEALNELK